MFKTTVLAGFLALVSLANSWAANAGTVLEGQKMPSRILGKDVEYTVYLPPKYEAGNRSYPVIYLMHGGGKGKNTDWYRFGGADRVFDRMIESGEVPAFIAVTPEGRRDKENRFNTYYMNDADGGYRWQDMFLQEFVSYIDHTYRTVPEKEGRGILGLSMGGYAAIVFSFKQPEMFSAAAALSAAFRTDGQVVEMDQSGYDRRYGKAWGLGLAGKGRLNAAYHDNSVLDLVETIPAEQIGKTALYMDCGSSDDFFAGNSELHLKLQKLGVEHRFIAREGGHDWAYWRSGLPEALSFVGASFRNG